MLMPQDEYARIWASTLAHLRVGNREKAEDFGQQLVDALRAEGLDIE